MTLNGVVTADLAISAVAELLVVFMGLFYIFIQQCK